MALPFTPKPGEILMCAFAPVGAPHVHNGEMVKTRPVIVVSRDLPGRGKAVTVVPVSMTQPNPIQAYHVEVDVGCFPPPLRAKAGIRWAICDQVCTVSRDRLDMIQGPHVGGKKQFLKGRVHMPILMDIRRAVAHVLKIDCALLGCPDVAIQVSNSVAVVTA